MKPWQKTTLWVLIPIVCIGILCFGGCVCLVKAMINSNSCTQFNIDNIETRTPIGIPKIHSDTDCFSCIMDKVANTKTNYFKIRTDVVDMDRYIKGNSFIPLNELNLDLSVFGKLTKTPDITPENMQHFYYSIGVGKRELTDWLAILDKKSGDIWVYMKYKD